jgi:homocitrate synthase
MIPIMKKLDNFGIQYMELPNPRISEEMVEEISSIILYRNQHHLRIKLLLHVRLIEEDINAAIACKGIDGLNITIGTSKTLATNSHRLTINDICKRAKYLLQSIDRKNLIIRFSGEDSFRSDEKDLYYLLSELAPYMDRFGIPDTLGIATSSQIKTLIDGCKAITTKMAYECHFHNDSGCATANAFEAWLCGVRYINTTILGIGERNGITSMADFVARMYTYDKSTLKDFNLMKLVTIHQVAANIFGFSIPPNTPIIGDVCFYHKAGIHTKAMLNNNNTYQAIDPNDFGLKTQIAKFSSLTGWNTVKHALSEIGIDLPDEKVKLLTQTIKSMK